MELEGLSTREAYVQLLIDSLKRKTEILEKLIKLTKQQEGIIASDPFNEDEFLKTISDKEEQILLLSKLDDGFEQIYQSVKDELSTNKEKYTKQIAVLKERITGITDAGVELVAMEKRNKTKLEVIFSNKKRDIKNSKISSQTAASYYKNMANQDTSQSFFYDKKK